MSQTETQLTSTRSAPAARMRLRDLRRRDRARDCTVLAVGAMVLFLILAVSGALGWIEAITACIVVGAGTLAYYVGSTPASPRALDAVEPARAPAPAAPSRRRQTLGDVIGALSIPALAVGADGRLAASNEGAQRVFRLTPGSNALAGAALRRPALLDAIEQVQAGGESVSLDLSTSPSEAWLAHVCVHGPSGAALIVLEDRAGVRRAEQARADFLANASHELRTPLTSLAGFIETMRGPARDDRQSWDRFLDIMYDQTERMRRLIADLLSLSRIEFSEHQPPETREDLAHIASSEADALRPVAGERGIELETPEPGGPIHVIAVRDEMAQVVQNFLSNALKYAGKNGRVRLMFGQADSLDAARELAGRRWDDVGRMTLREPPATPGGPGVWLRVEDDGPGIAVDHLPRLGERFYRVDESRGGDITGTGLGLAIVKHIMARHRGGMLVESAPGRGTAFGVWLPAAPDTALASGPGAASTGPVTQM